MLVARFLACLSYVVLPIAVPVVLADPTAAPTSTPPHSLLLISWKAEHGQWNFNLVPGDGEQFNRMSRSDLTEFAAGIARHHQESSWYTLDRAKSLLALYSDTARRLYWIGFPHFGNYYADLVQYPPSEIVEQVRREAMKHNIEFILKRVGE
jgi:hypothetical protein